MDFVMSPVDVTSVKGQSKDPVVESAGGHQLTLHVQKEQTELKSVADMVVKYLTPHFKDGRFASKVSYVVVK